MDIKGMGVDIDDLERAIEGDPVGLGNAFVWYNSKQGHDYWWQQACGKDPLDIEALKEIREAYLLSKGVAPEEHPAEMAARLNIVITVKVGDISYTYDGRKTQ